MTDIDDSLVRSFGMDQPVFVELDVLDRIAAVGVGDVNLAVAGLNHAGVGVFARIRFQMEWGFPGSAFIDRPRHTERGSRQFRIVEDGDQVPIVQPGHRDTGIRTPEWGRDSLHPAFAAIGRLDLGDPGSVAHEAQ